MCTDSLIGSGEVSNILLKYDFVTIQEKGCILTTGFGTENKESLYGKLLNGQHCKIIEQVKKVISTESMSN